MLNYEPVHGVDYLIDYYAILGIARDSSEEDITRVFREKITHVHPDIFDRASDSIKKVADKESRLLLEAYETLKDEAKKQIYDETLERFEKDHSRLISKNGNPIIDLSRRTVALDHLLSGNIPARDASMLQQVLAISGFNEDVFNIVADQYVNNPTPQTEKAYKDMLARKNAYLLFLEQLAWTEAGVIEQEGIERIQHPDQYSVRRMEQFEETKREISNLAASRLKALADGLAPKLLLGGELIDAEKARKDITIIQEEIIDRALANFSIHRSKIEEAAKERKKVLTQMVTLTKWEYFPPEQKICEPLLVLLEILERIRPVLFFHKVDRENMRSVADDEALQRFRLEGEAWSREELALAGNMEKIQCVLGSGASIVIVTINPELDWLLQISYAAQKHLEKIEGIY